jgi:1-phosphofructokinase family hexose kinase
MLAKRWWRGALETGYPMGESRIVTITLNPAVDRVMRVERFRVGQHCPARRVGHYPAGKGVNVSRVLAVLGVRSVATGFVGQRELAMFEEYLEQIGQGRITTQLLVVRGRTRDNITIIDPIDDTETHLRDEGFSVARDDVVRVSSKVGMLARRHAILCFCGSLPPGVRTGDLRSMLHRCEDAGARAVVDTNSRVLRSLIGERFWMLKANTIELSAITGMPTDSEDEAIAAARTITRAHGGNIEWVIGTRGEQGAILVGPNTELVARTFVHPGLVLSTVGCGDSLLAGVLSCVVKKRPWADALRLGVAAGTANAVSREAGEISPEDIQLYHEASVVESKLSEVV